jgi:hypothetical protein
MAVEPISPTLAQTVVQIGFAHVIENAVDLPFFLAVAEINEAGAAAPEQAKLPFRKGIAALKPAVFDDQLPTAIKSRGRIGSVFNPLQNGSMKLRRARLVRIEKQDPGITDAAILDRPVPAMRTVASVLPESTR